VSDSAVEPNPWIGPKGQRMERLELHITYTCPERCVFCSEDHRMQAFNRFPVTWGRVATVLRLHASRGVRNVHFTGGEPTIHPRFIDILRLAKKLRLRTSVGTIGTMICREDWAKEAMPYLDEGLFSLHGPDAATHDALTQREGSFERVTTALKNAQRFRPGFGAFVNTVICTDNVDVLPETVALAASLGAKLIVVSNTTPEGAAYDHYERLAVPLSKLAEVLPMVPARAGDAVVRFFGVPMCLMGEHRMLSNDLHWDPRVTVEWAQGEGKVVLDGIYSWTPDRKRTHVAACANCSLNQVCMGVYDRYAELWPVDELVAV
jgi:MoaA/NifB/PqqE/SkfB family radical SAM enzyme